MRRRIPCEWAAAVEWRRVTAVSGQRERWGWIQVVRNLRMQAVLVGRGLKVDELRIVPVMTVRTRDRSRAARSSRGVRERLPAVGVRCHLRPSGYPNEGIVREKKKEDRMRSTNMAFRPFSSHFVVLAPDQVGTVVVVMVGKVGKGQSNCHQGMIFLGVM